MTPEEWKKIAEKIPGRTAKECKSRWEWLHTEAGRKRLGLFLV